MYSTQYLRIIHCFNFRFCFFFILVFSDITAAAGKYVWLHENDLYDFVVIVTVHGQPSGVGILFDQNLVLTTATVAEDKMHFLNVYAIYGKWNRSEPYSCMCGITPYRMSRKKFWMSVGVDGHHCPIHDIFVLYCPTFFEHFGPEAVNATYRMAYSTYLARPHHSLLADHFKMAAFGYVDQDHVEKMNQLEVDLYHEGARVECDDYIPREWGRFICLRSDWHVVGVHSGAPLIHRGLVYGIGCFALQKGDETILVYTDIRGYTEHLHFCKRNFFGGKTIYYWWSRYWG